MAVLTSSTSFPREQFLSDFTKTSDLIGATYSESAIEDVLDTFANCLKDSAVVLRTTDRPNDVVNYRVYLRHRLDAIDIATNSGYLKPGHKMARLAACWSSLFDGDSQQWCDFHPELGVAKTWINFKGSRPMDEVLGASEASPAMKAHIKTFRRLGLEFVRFAAVDYDGGSANFYLTAPGPISKSQAAEYTALAQCSAPTDQEFNVLRDVLNPKGFSFAVTMDAETGSIKRVAFYAGLPATALPPVNDRLVEFCRTTPSYDKQPLRIFAWSFGMGNKRYVKAELSYIGDLVEIVRGIGSPIALS